MFVTYKANTKSDTYDTGGGRTEATHNLDRKRTIRNKIHKRESKLLKQNNKEEKEILSQC